MTTIRITDSEFDLALAPERKLSRVPPGHWRCVVTLTPYARRRMYDTSDAPASWLRLGDERFLCSKPFVSREVADERGGRACADANRQMGGPVWAYVRADYFPGERP